MTIKNSVKPSASDSIKYDRRKKESRRYKIAKVCLMAAILFLTVSSFLYYLTPNTFGAYSIVVSVGVGGLITVVGTYMHHESRRKSLM